MKNEPVKLWQAIKKLEEWLIKNDFESYEPFDGLSSFLRPLTFYLKFPQQALQQIVRRIPFNIRPIIGIKPSRSTVGMSFTGAAYVNLYVITGKSDYKEKAQFCFNWLIENPSKRNSTYSWGNSFDYISRGFYLPKYQPTIVWTSLIGHHFIRAYRVFKDPKYKDAVKGVAEFILHEIPLISSEKGTCLSYVPFFNSAIHNANLLGACILAEAYKEFGNTKYLELSKAAINYSLNCQLSNGAWYYGEDPMYHWIDNWHTAYNLNSILGYQLATKDKQYDEKMKKGFDFYVKHFFKEDGAPKYYWNRDYKFDIQSCSQSIDTLVLFYKYFKDKDLLELAVKVADWTIKNMQDPSGYFYLWKNKMFVNKTPTFHWGAGTIFYALSSLLLHSTLYDRTDI